MTGLKELIDALCSERCAGRATGTVEGRAAREQVAEAFVEAGLAPVLQGIPGCGGANILASLSGEVDRWVMVAAHYDHLGRAGGEVFWGADDNAAAVSILVEAARGLVGRKPHGRGVLFAAFDAEEPPHFLTETMGSEQFARRPTVVLDTIDLMICMDLVGHSIGPPGVPAEVGRSLLALGAERSDGTSAHVDRLARAVPGVIVRRADAEVIPPMSDYHAFWRRGIPFLFLTCGRSRRYHTPDDRPEHLDYDKMAATALWLEQFTRETCERPEPRVRFLEDVRDDASTLRSLSEIATALLPAMPQAVGVNQLAT